LGLIAAGRKRARIPLYLVLTALPAFALSALGHRDGSLDLERSLPEPATGNHGSLLILLSVLPAIVATFAVLALWFGSRVSSFVEGRGRFWIAPFSIVIELVAGIALSAALAISLAAGGALFNGLHEAAGGATLLRISALLAQMRPSPLADSNWWILALLALPIAPAFMRLLQYATRLFVRLLDLAGLPKRLRNTMSTGQAGARFMAASALRMLQLTPAALILFAIVSVVPQVAAHYGDQISRAGDAIILGCDRAAQSIEGWRFVTAALCPTGGPLCR
jgi:hypothetical protein